jgi:2-polyprenyl-6-methoxyphenol hydroxylase-like FAD-dependent oxidoreductase
MACELARHGATCRIVDALTTPLPYCRALGVTPRTLEVWEDMGIVREALDAGIELSGFRLEVEGRPAQDVIRDLSDLPYATLCLPQPETERILTQHLRHFHVEVERGVRLIAAKQLGDRVGIALEHDGMTEESSYRYVVGCDGAHSTVRRLAGIGFPGEAMPYDFMLGDVQVDLGLPRGMGLRAFRPRPGAAPDILIAVPLPDPNRYRITTFAPPDLVTAGGTDHGIQSERTAPTLTQLQAVLDRISPDRATLADMRWSSLFRISMRLAEHYRAGNLFLAGDAAHIHPPTGGQGMNTGIQDAYNLAWKMALVLKGAAPGELLDSYEVERHAEGADVLARTISATQNITQRSGQDDRLADTQITVAYAASRWIRDDTKDGFSSRAPIPGQRARDCPGLRRQGVGFPFRLFDILRGTAHVLLLDVGETATVGLTELHDLGGQLRQEFGPDANSRFRLVAIGTHPTESLPGILCLTDLDRHFRRTYASHDRAAWLVRPDGYLAWRGTNGFQATLLTYLRTIFRAWAGV